MRTDGRGELHNKSLSREYRIWANMLNRCYNPKVPGYKDYGGRGISVCEEWRHSFSTFLLDMGECPSDSHSLEREDNNGRYDSVNCAWKDRKAQARNRRSNRLVKIGPETKTLAEWVELSGIPHVTLIHRLTSQWPDDLILKPKVERSEIRSRGVVPYRRVLSKCPEQTITTTRQPSPRI